jgi:hypothetical protein
MALSLKHGDGNSDPNNALGTDLFGLLSEPVTCELSSRYKCIGKKVDLLISCAHSNEADVEYGDAIDKPTWLVTHLVDHHPFIDAEV